MKKKLLERYDELTEMILSVMEEIAKTWDVKKALELDSKRMELDFRRKEVIFMLEYLYGVKISG